MHMVRFHAKTKEQAFKTLFSCVLVTGLINFAAIVLLHMVEAKEHVKILLATLLSICTWSWKSVAKGFTKIRYWAYLNCVK